MGSRVRPFSNGSEYEAWTDRNCCKCPKWDVDASYDECKCDIDRALSEALFGEGTISPEIAARMGYPTLAYAEDPVHGRLRLWTWRCPEFGEAEGGEVPQDRLMRLVGAPMLPGFDR